MRVHDNHNDPLDAAESDLVLKRRARRQLLDGLQYTAHSDVVPHPTVDEMDVGAFAAVLKILHLPIALNRAAGRTCRTCWPDDVPHPERVFESAVTAVIVEGHRRKHHGDG